ncbi:protein of unknown function [Azospirillum baldaniorum]|uniref:Uncharacterized protein n=1 Tax=Azospirillum baldaniorum TaxID=1064539 RepID=A0A9P1NMP7_9PROT|nr:protein of unknown function [Azospirillum baldaniorum]
MRNVAEYAVRRDSLSRCLSALWTSSPVSLPLSTNDDNCVRVSADSALNAVKDSSRREEARGLNDTLSAIPPVVPPIARPVPPPDADEADGDGTEDDVRWIDPPSCEETSEMLIAGFLAS